MKSPLIICCLALLAGCNLFTSSEVPDAGTKDAATANDTATSEDATTPGDVATQPDVASPDVSPDVAPDVSPDGASCVAETDAELCAASAATCGEPIAVGDATRTEFQAEAGAAAACGTSGDFLNLCNSSGTTSAMFDATADGDFLIEIVARASLFGELPAMLEVSIDDVVVVVLPIQEIVPEGEVFSAKQFIPAGAHTLKLRFANDDVFNGADRNIYVDSYAVTGPLPPLTDRCGDVRAVDCGACGANETCGLAMTGVCACPCPLADGTCASAGPHPTLQCLECTEVGWQGVSGGCSDGNACTNDSCDPGAGMCVGTAITCQRGECEVGTCSGGSCQYAPVSGDACGLGGVCMAGTCGCADGVVTETSCTDNNDNDCDGLLNCADPDCDGLSCQGGKTCTAGLCQ